MIRPLALVVVALAAAPSASQVTVRVTSSLEAHVFGDLRRSQDVALDGLRGELGIAAEATDRFPPFPSVRLDASFPFFGDQVLGLEAGFSSSGGRVDYRDYSGAYRYDQLVERRFAGVYGERVLVQTGRLALRGTVRTRGSATRLTLNESLVVGGERLVEGGIMVKQVSLSYQPELAAEVRISGPAHVALHVGYEQQFRGGLTLDGEPVALDGDADQSAVNWSGPRGGLGLAVHF